MGEMFMGRHPISKGTLKVNGDMCDWLIIGMFNYLFVHSFHVLFIDCFFAQFCDITHLKLFL